MVIAMTAGILTAMNSFYGAQQERRQANMLANSSRAFKSAQKETIRANLSRQKRAQREELAKQFHQRAMTGAKTNSVSGSLINQSTEHQFSIDRKIKRLEYEATLN